MINAFMAFANQFKDSVLYGIKYITFKRIRQMDLEKI